MPEPSRTPRKWLGTWNAGRAGAALLGCALVVFVFIVAVFAAGEKQYRTLAEQSSHAHAIIDATQNVFSALKDAETGQRGFLITLEPEYLEPYESGRRAWTAALNTLETLTRTDEPLHSPVRRLADAGSAKLAELAMTVALARNEQRAAFARVETGEGRLRMDEARQTASQIIAREEAAFGRYSQSALETERRTRLSIEGASAALFLLTLAGTILLERALARQRRLSSELAASENRYRELAKSLERQVEERTRELQRINDDLKAFTYSVSHDLRAPLRAIDGFSQIVLEDHAAGIDEVGREYLGRIRTAVDRMGQIIRSLLDLSRVNQAQLRKQKVSISDLARSVIEELRSSNPDRQVEVHIEPDLVADGDPGLIRIVLQNLLSNAWKFTSRTPHAGIGVGAIQNGGKPEFFVRDNGAGFDSAYADKLFKPFQRLHSESEYEGTGIGLATALRVVRRHGGTMRAESRNGSGATFYFTL